MSKKYKIMLLSITILLVGTILLGTSYSLWSTNSVQEGTNEINVGCFKITFTNVSSYGGESAGDINLVNSYPITEEAGSALTPYMFNIKNQCSVASSYKVNLETLNESNFNLDYLRVKFNDVANVTNNTSVKYSTGLTDGTIVLTSQSSSAKLLTTGYLAAGEDKTYSLRAWIDYDATTETENVMGATWKGKVVVTSEATSSSSSSSQNVTTPQLLTNFVSSLFTEEGQTAVTNARYSGSSSNNYITFNNERWRILGLYNNIVKIVKDVPLDDYEITIDNGNLDISTSVTNAETGITSNVSYYDNLDNNVKSLIGNGTWNNGTVTSLNQNTSSIESEESASTVSGYIGTITISDYLYATPDASCQSIDASLYGDVTYANCVNTNYLKSQYNLWTLTPQTNGTNYSIVDGMLNTSSTTNKVLPVVYLNTSVLVNSGNGTINNPYIIGLE